MKETNREESNDELNGLQLLSLSSSSSISINSSDAALERIHALQNEVHFQDVGLTFTAQFDSGNMSSVTQVKKLAFEISSAPDCMGTSYETTLTTWFHFAILGGQAGQEISITITNLNKLPGLFANDHRPVFRAFPSQVKWERLPHSVHHELSQDKKHSRIHFNFKFAQSNERVHVAFCYPYPYADLQEKLQQWELRYPSEVTQQDEEDTTTTRTTSKTSNVSQEHRIYFHRELLIHSVEGRRVDLLTISSYDGITKEREERLPHLFPSRHATHSPRAHRFQNKRVIFVSARVHPGETPASFTLDGLLQFLLRRDDPRSQKLRQEFVFKIVPMLNPDGVARGHYRSDTLGQNLNRCYVNPSITSQPTIYATKALVLYWHRQGHLVMYLDLHAHACKRGMFLYGNALDSVERQTSTQLFAQLVGINSLYFEYEQCNFTKKNMDVADKRDGLSKNGSGRVVVYRETDMVHVYTVECNYNGGRRPTSLPPAHHDHGLASPGVVKRGMPPKYTVDMFQDVGKGLLCALLDLYSMNPWSRIFHSPWHTLEGMKYAMEVRVKLDRRQEANQDHHEDTPSDTPRKKYRANDGFLSSLRKGTASEKEAFWTVVEPSKSNSLTAPSTGTNNSNRRRSNHRMISTPR